MRKRNIFISRFDSNFNPKRDIDLVDFRELLSKKERNEEEHNRCCMYIYVVADILLHSSNFAGYPDEVKNEIKARGLVQSVLYASHFDGEAYPTKSAPFYYIYRIVYSMACHALRDYYKQMYIPFSAMASSPEQTMLKQVYDENEDDPIAVSFDYAGDNNPPPDIINFRRLHSIRARLKHRDQFELHLF